ncbi:RHS repeat-associated core domain-containing protein [Massilia endophytica]|uniref:RHS repeat-associated core domain-containing protein n=1 Tax=Massilia endophytica TaxID=2899220 RepID=UPI001E5A40AE|nr:RHS repeat-associated core domain-containing protein [Massilia endophytica]UGQ47857.1 type IV secretion protein Rhs [Massilia endophytica]
MKNHIIRLAACTAALLVPVVQAQDMTHYEYDGEGQLTRVSSPLGQTTQQVFDKLGRVTKQLLPSPAAGNPTPAISYSYDLQDQLIGVTDPRNLTTRYTVNGTGDRTLTASPDTGSTSFLVDATGDIVQMKDARGQITSFTYDALHRLTKAKYANSIATTFEYDTGSPGAIGQLSKMTDESGQTRYQYDVQGRLLSKEQTTGLRTFVIRYEYGIQGSALGKVTSMRYPSGNAIRFAYDDTGQLAEMTLVTPDGTAVPLLQDIRHQPFGPVRSWTWGSSALGAARHYSREYDLDARMVGYDMGNGVFRKLVYDAAGRIVRTQHENRLQGKLLPELDQAYAYDGLDHLVHFTGANTSQAYGYDDSGNRISTTFGANSYVNSYDNASNRLLATSGPSPARTLTYDAAGNLISDGSINFIYNARGRMQSATTSVGKVTYTYNGLGERVFKSGPESVVRGGKLHFVYDPLGPLLIGEYDAAGQALQETIYLGTTPVAVLQPGTNKMRPAVHYIYADHIETPRLIISAETSKVVWRWDSADPYGVSPPVEGMPGGGTFSYTPRFPGQYYDRETNLYYNVNRDYNPQTGSYVQSDPIGLAGSINTYAYADGNPLQRVDFYGLETCVVVTKTSYGLRDHAALYLSQGADDGGPFLFDPGGSYARSHGGGTGDFVDGNAASLGDFFRHHSDANGERTCQPTTRAEEQRLVEKILSLPPPASMLCAVNVSNVLAGSRYFPNVRPDTFFPGNLYRAAGGK